MIDISSAFFSRARSFWSLTKPRVLSLIVFCAMVGMFLSVPATQDIHWSKLMSAVVGIWLVAGSAAVINCFVEYKTDALMKRTHQRPLPQALLKPREALFFSCLIGFLGLLILHFFVNDLTAFLTLLTFIGYAIFYTILLKPSTPQNIVIGGASGAMPPVLGWSAMTGHLTIYPWVLFLMIFLWTPPHFWSLSLYRRDDYFKAGFPMLPVTHGVDATLISIVLYTILLFGSSLLPCLLFFSSGLYGVAAVVLGAYFIFITIRLSCRCSDQRARFVFLYSIVYLFLLFFFILFDHYL